MEQDAPDTWQRRADRLAREGEQTGAPPTAWFEQLYAAGDRGEVALPWDKTEASPRLVEWFERDGTPGEGGRAVVVGAGLGAEAGYVASRGWATTAFDVSPTAVRIAAGRSPAVEFVVADLFALPQEWHGAFDLVVEQYTVQALPPDVRDQVMAAIASLVAPGGRLVAIQAVLEPDDDGSGPPWPLTEVQVRSFGEHGLDLVRLETVTTTQGYPMWRAEYRRPE